MNKTEPASSTLRIVVRDRDGRTVSQQSFETQAPHHRLVEVKAERPPR